MRRCRQFALAALVLIGVSTQAAVSQETAASVAEQEESRLVENIIEKVDDVVDDVVGKIDDVVDEVATLSFWKRILMKTRKISGAAFILLMVLMLVLTYLDSRHPRKLVENLPVSILIPCYNDSASVQETIASVFKAYPAELVDLIVINDRSTDNSLARISEMARRHVFRIIDNEVNKGKARSLNDVIPLAKHDYVLCLDADTILNRSALRDMLARMEADCRLGAVSSPYRPKNRGFLPLMQAVEYSMLLLTQGAHNITSAMALWGGCMMVRKSAFAEVRGFRLNAITEDVDMAFRMNRCRWRVEQSFRPVRSLVPSSVRGWIKQKLRWTSGGTQCYFRHARVWIKNPIQLFFILSYSFFIASSVLDFFEGVDVVGSVGVIWDSSLSFWKNIVNLNAAFGADVLRRFGSVVLCCGLSCVYIFPLIKRAGDVFKLLLVIPFSMLYFPCYMIVSLFGTAIGIRSLVFPKKTDTCAWDTGPSN